MSDLQKKSGLLKKSAIAVAVCFGLVACGGGGGGTDGGTPTPTPTPTPTKTNFSQAFQEVSRTLPKWNEVAEIKTSTIPEIIENKISGSQAIENELIGSVINKCSIEKVSLTSSPEKLVTLSPDSDVLWLGGLIQGKTYLQGIGSLAELPIRQRAPMTIYIDRIVDGSPTGNQSMNITVENPTAATVQDAINTLISRMSASGSPIASKVFYQETESYSAEQTAMKLGVSAKFATASVRANLSRNHEANQNQLTAHFVEQMFVISMVSPQTPGDFFTSDFTKAKLDEQLALKTIAKDNLPVYVASIVYGRILNFNMLSTSSISEMKAAISASYQSVANRAAFSLSTSEKKTLSESDIKVIALGGDSKNAVAIIKSGDLKSYFDEKAPISTAVPIAYQVRNVNDGSNAGFSETTEYNLRQCKGGNVKVLSLKGEVQAQTGGNIFKDEKVTKSFGPITQTLPDGSYFIETMKDRKDYSSGANSPTCTFNGYSNYKEFKLKDGTIKKYPSTVSFSGKVTSPDGAGKRANLYCYYDFDYVESQP